MLKNFNVSLFQIHAIDYDNINIQPLPDIYVKNWQILNKMKISFEN